MVKYCYKCGRNNKNNKDVALFTIPTKNEGSEWHMEFIKRLGVESIEEKEIHVCSKHFKLEDLEIDGHMWTLKENALPVENEVEPEEEMIIRPEIVYLKTDDDSISDSNEAKELAPLEPLVEYVYGDEDVEETEEVEDEPEMIGEADGFDDGTQNDGVADEIQYTMEDGSQVISMVESEESKFKVEPMMPFFLTSSPVFTIMNENNEVGETIILEIDQSDIEKKPAVTAEQLSDLQNSLCTTKSDNIIGEYTCDICDNSYGCLNCLKSHYETFHILALLTQYKCKQAFHVSKSNVCPVCDRIFLTRNETLDHYITHSVACEVCGSGFDRQAHLTDHYRTAHPRTVYETSYDCELCKTGYQYPASLTKHYQTFHHMVLCHVCKRRFVSVHELQDHENVHREKLNVLPFACSKCDKAFPRISDIVVHIRADHKKVGGGRVSKKEEVEKNRDIVKVPVHKKIKVKK